MERRGFRMTLHDKSYYAFIGNSIKPEVVYPEKDVKEAVKEALLVSKQVFWKQYTEEEAEEVLDDKYKKIFGEGLIHSPERLTGKKSDTSPMLPVKNTEPLEVGCDGDLSSPLDTIQNSEVKE